MTEYQRGCKAALKALKFRVISETYNNFEEGDVDDRTEIPFGHIRHVIDEEIAAVDASIELLVTGNENKNNATKTSSIDKILIGDKFTMYVGSYTRWNRFLYWLYKRPIPMVNTAFNVVEVCGDSAALIEPAIMGLE
jgi:hypothetical protein